MCVIVLFVSSFVLIATFAFRFAEHMACIYIIDYNIYTYAQKHYTSFWCSAFCLLPPAVISDSIVSRKFVILLNDLFALSHYHTSEIVMKFQPIPFRHCIVFRCCCVDFLLFVVHIINFNTISSDALYKQRRHNISVIQPERIGLMTKKYIISTDCCYMCGERVLFVYICFFSVYSFCRFNVTSNIEQLFT